jgi:hypothetical protein
MRRTTLELKHGEATEEPSDVPSKRRREFTSTVGRGKAVVREQAPDRELYKDDLVQVHFGDSLKFYRIWAPPTCIVSDGAYGVLGCHLKCLNV